MTTTETAVETPNCPKCSGESKRFGRHRNGLRRFRCFDCHKTFTEAHPAPFRIEQYLGQAKGLLAIQLLLEGTSIRSAERITGLHRDAIMQLLLIAGERCERLINSIQGVMAKDVCMDEAWDFCFKKESHKRPEEQDNDSIGDVWTWIALESNYKLVLAYAVGRRSLGKAFELTRKIRRATSPDQEFQMTSDGLKAYLPAVDEMLGDRCSYAQLLKHYEFPITNEVRYSPARFIKCVQVPIHGDVDPSRISTSHVERFNLSLRTSIRRMTRLTLGFSKKAKNHEAAIALWLAYYNWCKIHGSLRVTPAMEAGIAAHVWTLAELLAPRAYSTRASAALPKGTVAEIRLID